MLKRAIAALAVLLGSPAWAAEAASAQAGQVSSSTAADAQERASMMREIQELKSRITLLEANQKAAPPAVQYSPAAPGRPKDHNLELYGFVQLDAIQDFKRVDPDWEATLRPSRIPTAEGAFGSDGQTIFSIRQSRLGLKADGTIAGKPYEARFEFDLFGTGSDAGKTTFKIRHAYASWGPIIAGQTNSLFMDGDISPKVIDYFGPPGRVFARKPQIRFTFLNRNGFKAAIALEHPTDDIDPGNIRLIDPELGTNVRPNEELPDLTAQVRYGGQWGHVQLAGIARKIGFDTVGTEDNEPKGSEFGWGINLTSAIKVSPATFRLGIVYGKGIATYMSDGGMDLAPSASLIPGPPIPPSMIPLNLLLEAEAVPLLGVSAYVELQWAKQLSSTLGYSFTKVDNTNFQQPAAFHKGAYASGNLLWTPADQLMTGVELLWGKRTDNDGETGTDLRLQSSFKYSFSSKDIWGLVEDIGD
jgi:hypothetical protein